MQETTESFISFGTIWIFLCKLKIATVTTGPVMKCSSFCNIYQFVQWLIHISICWNGRKGRSDKLRHSNDAIGACICSKHVNACVWLYPCSIVGAWSMAMLLITIHTAYDARCTFWDAIPMISCMYFWNIPDILSSILSNNFLLVIWAGVSECA